MSKLALEKVRSLIMTIEAFIDEAKDSDEAWEYAAMSVGVPLPYFRLYVAALKGVT